MKSVLGPSSVVIERADARGFSLVELTIAVALVVILVYGLHTTLLASTRGRKTVHRVDRVSVVAGDYLDRLRALPFGSTGGTASASQLQELFDDDQDLGNVTLRELRSAPEAEGHWFVATHDGITGRWRIKVSSDLNGDRDADDLQLREGRDDLLGVEIWFDRRLVARTCLAASYEDTRQDVGVGY